MRKKIRTVLSVVGILLIIGAIFFLPRIIGDAMYPVKYEAEINAAADEFNIDRPLLYALVLSESRFRSDVVSHAGAVGLMQLMPGTAAGVAKRLGITGFKSSDLYDPAINARLGAAYLRSLLDRYNQSVELALMGYNGGPGAANRYLAGGTLPRETNRYYQIVMQRQQKYAELFATGSYTAEVSEATPSGSSSSAPVVEEKKKPTGVQGAFTRWFGL